MCRVTLNYIQKVQGLCSTPEITLKSSYKHIVSAALSAAVGKVIKLNETSIIIFKRKFIIRVIRLNLRVFLF